MTPEDASGAVFEQIDTLQSMGFNDFLLVDLIPLEYSRQLGTSTTHDQMADLVKRYNAAHQSRVSELQTDGKNIQLFSAHNLWQQVIDDPSQYMASPQPIEQVCRNRPGHEGGKPDDCTGYFFFGLFLALSILYGS